MIFAHTYAFASFDNIYTSVKLLMLRYLSASGNAFRQALEASCMAILISTDVELKLNKSKSFRFFPDFKKKKRYTFSNKSIRLVRENWESLDVVPESIEMIDEVQKILHQFSHPAKQTIAMRYIGKDGRWTIKGRTDPKSLPLEQHLISRINFTKILPDLIINVYHRTRNA